MSKKTDRSVYRRSDNSWVNKQHGNSKASSIHDTQKAAMEAARDMLVNQGGGELNVHGRNGQIRSKDTIAPGNDPFPPRDTEH